MKPALIALGLIAITAAVPAVLSAMLNDPPGQGSACEGARPPAPGAPVDPYAETVRCAFIESGLLIVRAEDEPGYPIVRLSAPPPPPSQPFIENSRLLEDLIADDPAIWRFEGERLVGIQPFRHRERLPSARVRAWQQSLLYRPGSDPGGPKATDPITLLPVEPDLPAVHLPFTLDPESNESVRPYQPLARAADVSSPHVDLPCPGEEPAGRLLRVGTDILVRAGAVGSGKCSLSVGRTTLEEPDSVAVLAAGETLTVRYPDGKGGYALLRDRPTSVPRALNWPTPSGRRRADPASGDWGVAAGEEIVRWMAAGTRAGRAATDDLALSLDAALQRFTQRRLDQFVTSAEGIPRGQAPVRVSAVVMDALTGEILALAGIAVGKTDDEEPIQTSPALDLLPIGSAMKPLVAAAILSERPQLAGLCVRMAPQGPDGGSILGRRLKNPVNATPGDTDFATFIRTSNNAYLPAMVLLASTTPGAGVPLAAGEAWGYGRCSITTDRPASIWDNRLDPQDDRAIGQRSPPPWVPRLAAIFSLNPAPRSAPARLADASGWNPRFAADCHADQPGPPAREPAYGSPTIDAGPWRALKDRRDTQDGWCGLDGIASPRREALNLSGRRGFEADIVQSILGNGEGRVSTVKLAEAYARLVTGRRIEASYLPAEAPVPPLPSLDPVYPPAMRAQMRAALASVISNGTGTRAAPPLDSARQALAARGYMLEAFGKTGTPTLVRLGFGPTDRAINSLILRRCLRWSGSRAALSDDRPECAGATTREVRRRIEALNALGPDTMRADRSTDRGAAGWSVRNNVLTGVAPAQQVERYRTYGGVFGLVVEVRPASQPPSSARPVRAYSIAVNISHGVEDGSAKAAALAGDIAARLLQDRLTALPRTAKSPAAA